MCFCASTLLERVRVLFYIFWFDRLHGEAAVDGPGIQLCIEDSDITRLLVAALAAAEVGRGFWVSLKYPGTSLLGDREAEKEGRELPDPAVMVEGGVWAQGAG